MGKTRDIVVFTDGACSNNGYRNAVGGIGIHFPDHQLEDISEVYEGACTNNRAELYAILRAIKYIEENMDIERTKIFIFTDSSYSVSCITKWIKGWINDGWIKKNGEPVLNRDILEELYDYYENYKIVISHVKGHTGLDDENSIADRLASNASKKAKIELKKSSGSKKSIHKSTSKKSKHKSSSKKSSEIKKNVKRMPRDYEVELV